MSDLPSRHIGELVVAAIRVLEHREKHPPRETEIGALLLWHEDRTRVLVNALANCGVLSAVRSAFDVRFKVGDPAQLAALPVDDEVGDTIAREMADFDERSRDEAERLEKLLGTPGRGPHPGDAALSGLEDEFGQFRRSKPKNPFGNA